MTTTPLKGFQESVVREMTAFIKDSDEPLLLLLDCPTAGGKTLMLAATLDDVSTAGTDYVWFWFAPFAGLIEQSGEVLREETLALRVRDIRQDRRPSSVKTGDVFVMTWATVASSDTDGRLVRTELTEEMPSIDNLVAQLRERGFKVGCVGDEAHLNLKTGRTDSEAFAFFHQVLRPDVTLLATATPDKTMVAQIRNRLAIDDRRYKHVPVARDLVVAERLNKRGIRSVVFQAKDPNANALIDTHAKAIQLGHDCHRKIKSALAAKGIELNPLLLVQVSNQRRKSEDVSERPTDDAKRELLRYFREDQIAVHTADEPDARLLEFGDNEKIEAIVFKTAIATGFNLPRAWTLVALRNVATKQFGLQIAGRTMRVHSLLQQRDDILPDSILEYAHVVLASPAQQGGLQDALSHISPEALAEKVAQELSELSPNVAVICENQTAPSRENSAAPAIGLLDAAGTSMAAGSGLTPAIIRGTEVFPDDAEYGYPLRTDVQLPALLTEAYEPAAESSEWLTDQMLNEIRSRAGDVSVVAYMRKVEGKIIQRQYDSAGSGVIGNPIDDKADLNRSRIMMRALNSFNIGHKLPRDSIIAGLREWVCERVEAMVPLSDTDVLNSAYLLLSNHPKLIRQSYEAIMAKSIVATTAEPLPAEIKYAHEAKPANKNLYRVMPPDLNKWETKLAELLEDHSRVVWWHRNPPGKPHSVRIIRTNGQAFYPDFVVMINGRKKGNGIVLLDPHERMDEDTKTKVRTEHRVYGKPVILRLQQNIFYVVGVNDLTDTLEVGGRFDLAKVME